MIQTVIIDDEKKARETIHNIIKLYCENVTVVGEAASIKSAVELINKHRPDLVLLDINLSGETGFDLFQHFSNINFKVVFITAYHEHAVKAFKYSALDFILKPVNPDELIEAVNKVQTLIEKENINVRLEAFISNMKSLSGEIKKIVLKTNDSIHVLNIPDILRCEADGNYTRFWLSNGKYVFVSNTLKEYEDVLLSTKFFRPHQSHLINTDYIERYEKKEGFIIMKDGSEVPVATRKKDAVLALLETL